MKYRNRLYKRIGNVQVWLVDGNGIRRNVSSRFKDSGVHKIFSFIPEKEIWVDERLDSRSREIVILKSLREYNLLNDGQKRKDVEYSVNKVISKCQRFPLLIPYRYNQEVSRLRRKDR